MSKRRILSLSAAAAASVLALVVVPGCGDDTTSADTCFDYSSFNAMSKTVTFQTDVLPIFRQSCGLSAACHGSQAGPAGQPFLGPSKLDPDPDAAAIQKIFDQNVGVNSTKAATMKIVEAGSPEKSFLMHKMDNTLKCADVVCESGCGTSMPQSSPILADADRDIVRLWIAQGAKND